MEQAAAIPRYDFYQTDLSEKVTFKWSVSSGFEFFNEVLTIDTKEKSLKFTSLSNKIISGIPANPVIKSEIFNDIIPNTPTMSATAYVILNAIDMNAVGEKTMDKRAIINSYKITLLPLLSLFIVCGISLMGLNFIPYVISYVGFTMGLVGSIAFGVDYLKRVKRIG